MNPLNQPMILDEKRLIKKVSLKLIPFLFILYIVAYLDRVNVGFAKLQFNAALGFSETVYGFGAGIFFLGYFLFEIPSNLILERVGARKWIARIMVTWGILACAMMFTWNAASFYTLRFLLGIAEAGFFPGMILYLTYWFVSAERARMVALFMTAGALSNVVGAPISGVLLKIEGWGLAGWQWLFLLEGLPAVLLGFVVLNYLPDGPEKARWLTEPEREFLLDRREAERQKKTAHDNHSLAAALANPRVWLFSILYFMLAMSSYGVTFFLPQIVKTGFHLTDQQTGMVGNLTAIPYLFAAVFMVLNGLHSDKTGERRFHVAGSALISAVGFFVSSTQLNSPWLSLLFLSVACMGIWGCLLYPSPSPRD